jgi:hypothetical protein
LRYNEVSKLALFINAADNKEFLKKVMPTREVKEGEMINSSHYLIEITSRKINEKQGDVIKPLKEFYQAQPVVKGPVIVKPKADINHQTKIVHKSFELPPTLITRNVVYTEDKHKKLKKKWLDGKLHYEQETCKAKFYDEDSKLIFNRNLSNDQVYDGSEFVSARYQFIIGEEIGKEIEKANILTPFICANQVKTDTSSEFKKSSKNFKPPKKRKIEPKEESHEEYVENFEPIIHFGKEASKENYIASFVPSSKFANPPISQNDSSPVLPQSKSILQDMEEFDKEMEELLK